MKWYLLALVIGLVSAGNTGWFPDTPTSTPYNLNGWLPEKYSSTLQVQANGPNFDAVIRGPSGLVYLFNVTSTVAPNGLLSQLAGWSDANGWGDASSYSTIRFANPYPFSTSDVVGRYPAGSIGIAVLNGLTLQYMTVYGLNSQFPNGTEYYSTIHWADVNGDGYADFIIRNSSGLIVRVQEVHYVQYMSFVPYNGIEDLADIHGWNQPQYYGTFQFGKVNDDNCNDLVARGIAGMRAYLSPCTLIGNSTVDWQPITFTPANLFPDWEGWADPKYYSTIKLINLGGGAYSDLMARGYYGLHLYLGTGNATFEFKATIASFADYQGTGEWTKPQFYTTIAAIDIDNDGRAEILGRYPGYLGVWRSTDSTFSTWNFYQDQGIQYFNTTAWNADNNQYYSSFRWVKTTSGTYAVGRASGGLTFQKVCVSFSC